MGKIPPQYSKNGRKWRQSQQLQEPSKILTEVLGQRLNSSQFKVKELDKNSERKRHNPEAKETITEQKNQEYQLHLGKI